MPRRIWPHQQRVADERGRPARCSYPPNSWSPVARTKQPAGRYTAVTCRRLRRHSGMLEVARPIGSLAPQV